MYKLLLDLLKNNHNLSYAVKRLSVTFSVCLLLLIAMQPSNLYAVNSSRIKDIVNFEGIRDNMLLGYGLVVGLNGTGDKIDSNPFTEQSMVSFLERLGVNVRGSDLSSQNVAAVTVTATLPPFSRYGSRIDVSVSALGDANSLLGGTLLATPLYGANGEVYAVAQGAVSVSAFEAGGNAASITKGVPTSGIIANGAIIEREIDFALNEMEEMRLALRNPDITTARRITEAVNKRLGLPAAIMQDPGTVKIKVPRVYEGNVANLIADIEQLRVQPDQMAKVLVDEASGTIVMGENVQISPVAVAQGNLVVKVSENPIASQPDAFSQTGQTAELDRTNIEVNEGSNVRLTELRTGPTLRELVTGLNALGVGPQDLITILQSIKAAGALQAEIETR